MNNAETATDAVRVLVNATKALLVVTKELAHINRLLVSPVGTDGQICSDTRIKLATLEKFAAAYATEVRNRNQQLQELGIMT